MEEAQPRALKLLSLDAGGPKGISQLRILVELMERLSLQTGNTEERPCDVFDTIGGTGTGGLIAILLAVLQMSARQALEAFTQLVLEVFTDPDQDPKKQTDKLKKAVNALLQCHGFDGKARLCPTEQSFPSCRAVVPVTVKVNAGWTYVLRNFPSRQGYDDITISEAMVVTCLVIPLFAPISIGDEHKKREYISGEFGLGNPIREITKEALQEFGNDFTVACLLSIGSGHPKTNPILNDTSITEALAYIAKNSERTANEMEVQMLGHTLYYRFSIEAGAESLELHFRGDVDVDEQLDRCVDTIKEGNGTATLEQLTLSGGTPTPSVSMPALTRNYVERKLPLEYLETALFGASDSINEGAKIVVVTGIGGCGKTRLIRSFIEKHGYRFLSPFFVDGSTKATITAGIKYYVRSLGTTHSQKSFEQSISFLSHSVINQQRFMVLDNVDDPQLDLTPFLPRWENGVVVITSRSPARGELSPSSHLKLDVMSLGESLEMLARGSREGAFSEVTRPDFIKLAKELGHHPIAVAQAISYMWNTGIDAKVYTTRLVESRIQLASDHPATSQSSMRYRTVFATFHASYSIIRPDAQKLCHILAFFHWKKLPRALIKLAVESNFSTVEHQYVENGEAFRRGKECLESAFCSSGPLDEIKLDSMIAELVKHSLITIIPAEGTQLLEMHQLVHQWGRFHIPMDLERFQDAAIRLLCCGVTRNNHLMMQYLFNHVQALENIWESLHPNDAASFSFILDKCGIYTGATRLMEIVYESLKTQLGVGNRSTDRASHLLQEYYSRLGRHTEARILRQEAEYRRNTDLFGENDRKTIRIEASLRLSWGLLQRERAMQNPDYRRLHQQILGSTTRSSHTLNRSLTTMASADNYSWYNTMTGPGSTSNLSGLVTSILLHTRYNTEDDKTALPIQVLRITENRLGEQHPDTILALEDLAKTCSELRSYEEAVQMMKIVRRRREQYLGVGNPETITASANLAIIYNEAGRYGDAVVLMREVLTQREERLGEGHRDTISAMFILAKAYRELQQISDAKEMMERAKEIVQAWPEDPERRYEAASNFLQTINEPARLLITS